MTSQQRLSRSASSAASGAVPPGHFPTCPIIAHFHCPFQECADRATHFAYDTTPTQLAKTINEWGHGRLYPTDVLTSLNIRQCSSCFQVRSYRARSQHICSGAAIAVVVANPVESESIEIDFTQPIADNLIIHRPQPVSTSPLRQPPELSIDESVAGSSRRLSTRTRSQPHFFHEVQAQRERFAQLRRESREVPARPPAERVRHRRLSGVVSTEVESEQQPPLTVSLSRSFSEEELSKVYNAAVVLRKVPQSCIPAWIGTVRTHLLEYQHQRAGGDLQRITDALWAIFTLPVRTLRSTRQGNKIGTRYNGFVNA